MTEWLALVTPIVIALSALLLFRKKLVWWEILSPIVVCIVVIMIMKYTMETGLTTDTEYRSSHVTKLVHEDEWDEYIHKTCSYTTYSGSGKNRTSHTHYYDCSYVDNHPEQWNAYTNDGNVYGVSPEYYKSAVKLFNNERFLEMNRHYHHIDGDAHSTFWPTTLSTVIAIDSEEEYENRAQAAATVFHFVELDSIKQVGLYQYPVIKNEGTFSANQQALLTPKNYGNAKLNNYNNSVLRKINGMLGKDKQIKVFVLVYKNHTIEVAERQRTLWKGGNKNELVICVDADNKWTKSFSWSDDKRLETEANYLFADTSKSLTYKLLQLHRTIPADWHRKSFSDFAYIDVPLHTNQLIWIHIISILVTLGFIFWGVHNQFESDENGNTIDKDEPWNYRR